VSERFFNRTHLTMCGAVTLTASGLNQCESFFGMYSVGQLQMVNLDMLDHADDRVKEAPSDDEYDEPNSNSEQYLIF